MISLGPCEITAVIGPMASGKTYLINQWLKAGQNRYVRFDATGETCEDTSVEHIWQNPFALWTRLKANPYYFKIAYHPGSDLQADFLYTLKCLWRLDADKLLVCDEFHEVCGVNDAPDYVKTMMRYARHAKLGVIGASQRLADVHKLFTGGARQVILFKNDDPRDIEAVRARYGPQTAEMYNNLRPCIYNDLTKVCKQIPQCIVKPRGGAAQVFDFAKDAYVTVGKRPDSSEDESIIPSEHSSGEAREQLSEGDSGNEDQSSDATS